MVGNNFDGAAVAITASIGRNSPRSGNIIASKADLACSFPQGIGLNHAGVVDSRIHQGILAGGCHNYQTTVSLNQLFIGNRTLVGAVCYGYRHFAISVVVQTHARASSQIDTACLGGNNSLIDDLLGQKIDIAILGGNSASIDYWIFTVSSKAELSLEKILIGYIQGRGSQAPHIHRGARTEKYPVRVYQDNLAIGCQLTKNLRRIGAYYPVQQYGLAVGLIDMDSFPTANAEVLPVDNGLSSLLGNGHGTASGSNGCLTSSYLSALRQGIGGSSGADNIQTRSPGCKGRFQLTGDSFIILVHSIHSFPPFFRRICIAGTRDDRCGLHRQCPSPC